MDYTEILQYQSVLIFVLLVLININNYAYLIAQNHIYKVMICARHNVIKINIEMVGNVMIALLNARNVKILVITSALIVIMALYLINLTISV